MKIRVFLSGLLLLAATTAAFAEGPYIGAAGGVSIVHDGDISIVGVGEPEMEYDTGYGFNVTAGYSADNHPLRLELEFGYKKSDVDKISGDGVSVSVNNTDITVLSYMVNLLFDFKNDSKFTPYFGGGMGLLNGELEFDGGKEDDTAFGCQGIAGVAYNVNRNLAIDLSYRFQSAPNDFKNDGVAVEYNSSNIMAGLRYNF